MWKWNRKNKTLLGIFNCVVLLSVWSSSLVTVLCPHMAGDSSCCAKEKAGVSHQKMFQTNMPDMDGMSMDHSGMEMETTNASNTEAENTAHVSSYQNCELNVPGSVLETATNTDGRIEAITQPVETCAHCLMHSQAPTFTTPSIVAHNASSREIINEPSPEFVKLSYLRPALFDPHDNSPPGPSTCHYVLISVFRI